MEAGGEASDRYMTCNLSYTSRVPSRSIKLKQRQTSLQPVSPELTPKQYKTGVPRLSPLEGQNKKLKSGKKETPISIVLMQKWWKLESLQLTSCANCDYASCAELIKYNN